MSREEPDPIVARNVRRLVGLSVLRRLGRMAQTERATEADNARWAQRLLWFFAALAALLAGLMLLR